MDLLNVYRRRQGDYILVTHPRKHEAGDGSLYLGVVAGTSFDAPVRAAIGMQLAMKPFALLTPGQFYGAGARHLALQAREFT